MPTNSRRRFRHRALFISDVHLGSPGCKATALAEFLKRNDCERLYVVGDLFDGWKLKRQFFWTPDHTRVLKEIIAKARRGTKVYYLTGNHDAFMRQFIRRQLNLGKVRIVNEVIHTAADGRRLLVLHGDVFDEVVERYPLLAHASDACYQTLMRLDNWFHPVQQRLGLPRWSSSAAAKGWIKTLVQTLSGVDSKVVFRCERDRLHGVICGHTHHAEIRPIERGITWHNCGDWVESCTALAEDHRGQIRILSVDSIAGTAKDGTVRRSANVRVVEGDAGYSRFRGRAPVAGRAAGKVKAGSMQARRRRGEATHPAAPAQLGQVSVFGLE